MTEYEKTVDYILNIPMFAKKMGHENLSALLDRLGHPEEMPHIIHVAGTNGKGSTCKALSAILMKDGYKVGLFTSPHLVSINERIQINGVQISDEDFVDCFEKVKKEFDIHPSFFEVIFAMAAVYFKEKQVDYVIYETGMGGRLDATNVVKPELTIITSVSYDHMEYLGNTIEEIASEKAGIIKTGVPVLYFKRDDVSAGIIEDAAKSLTSNVVSVEKSEYIINLLEDKSIDFSLHNRYYSYDHLKIRRTSLYQVENACLAVAAYGMLMGDDISENAIRLGLQDFYWEGRMDEVLPGVYVDGAHNEEAICSFTQTLKKLHGNVEKILVFAAVKDKDYKTMIKRLTEDIAFDKIIVTNVSGSRRASLDSIAGLFEKTTGEVVERYETIPEAMDRAMLLKSESENRNIYCVGSLYLVGGIKEWIAHGRPL